MNTAVGLWIDYKEAVIVTCMSSMNKIRRLPSHIEKIITNTDVPNVSQQDRYDSRLDVYLSRYYGKVIGAIRHADSIMIFGPGEAKSDLHKRLVSQGLVEKVISVETSDRMTSDQITAKVREHFRQFKSEN